MTGLDIEGNYAELHTKLEEADGWERREKVNG
jgi:hypothetical protein